MALRRRRLVRIVPFATLHKEKQEERDGEVMDERPAPVQPAGYGMGHGAEDPAALVAERDLVQRTLAQLPEGLRTCLLLSIVAGLSSHEIAGVLGLGEAAVRQRLSRARKLFQQVYLRESGDFVAAASAFSTRPQRRRCQRRRSVAHRAQPALVAAS